MVARGHVTIYTHVFARFTRTASAWVLIVKIAASDKASGIMALDPAAAKGYLARGVDFVAVSIDARTLALGLRAIAADMRAG